MDDETAARLQTLTDAFIEQTGDAGAGMVEAYWAKATQQINNPALSPETRTRLLRRAESDYEAIMARPDAETELIVATLSEPSDFSARDFLQRAVPPEYLKPEDEGETMILSDGEEVQAPDYDPIILPSGEAVTMTEDLAHEVLAGMTHWPMGNLNDGGIYTDQSGLSLSDQEVVDFLASKSLPGSESAHDQLSGWSGGDDNDEST